MSSNHNSYYLGTGQCQNKLGYMMGSISMYRPDRRQYYQTILYLLWKIYNRYHDTSETTCPQKGQLMEQIKSFQLRNDVPDLIKEMLSFENITGERLESAMDQCLFYSDNLLVSGK
jgi:hypothetical protein